MKLASLYRMGCIIAIPIVVLSMWTIFSNSMNLLFVSRESPFKTDEAEKVVHQFSDRLLKDNDGVVDLPANMATLTADGKVYLTRNTIWGNAFLFVTWRGKGSNLRGYIYFEGLNDKLLLNPALLKEKTPREFLGPIVPFPGNMAPYGKIELEIEQTDSDGWYKALRDAD